MLPKSGYPELPISPTRDGKARRTLDPITGQEALLVCSRDVEDRVVAAFVDAETAESLRRALGTLRLLGCVAVVAGVLPGLARLLVEAEARLGARAYQTVEEALRGLSRASLAFLATVTKPRSLREHPRPG